MAFDFGRRKAHVPQLPSIPSFGDGISNKPYLKDFIPSNCSISTQEMLQRKYWATYRFKEISTNAKRNELLSDESNWMIIIDSMYQSGDLQGTHRMQLLQQLLKISKNTLSPLSDQYRIIKHEDLNQMTAKHKGFRVFIETLGFNDAIMDDRLVMNEPNHQIINTAVNAIQNKLKLYHLYEELCTQWQLVMNLMLEHPLYKTNINSAHLNKCIQMDFVLHYDQYYDILTKLQSISTKKIYSRDGFILQMMTNIGFNLSQIGDDDASNAIFNVMEDIYNLVKRIEEFKESIRLNHYYNINGKNINRNVSHRVMDIKVDYDDDSLHDITVQEVNNRKETGIPHFASILSMKSDDERCLALLNPINWNILIDAICLNMTAKDNKIKRLTKLKNMTQKACHDPERRIINLENKTAKKNIVYVYGAMELLQGAGFEKKLEENGTNQLMIFEEKNSSQPIIDVMINAVMHKIDVLTEMNLTQITWHGMCKILLQHPSFADQNNTVQKLLCMDLENNYKDYYGILDKVKKIKATDSKKVPMEFLTQLQLDLGDIRVATQCDKKSTTMLLYNLFGIYDKMNKIEGMKRRYKYAMNQMVPSLQRLATEVKSPKTTGGNFREEDILERILQFALRWNDDRYDKQQLISDEDLAQLYKADDWNDLENEMLTKVYELQHDQSAITFQMDEFLKFISNFRYNKKDNQNRRKCLDIHCEWKKYDKTKLFSLIQRQTIHVMFYHTKDYVQISTQMRSARFRYDTDINETPGNTQEEEKEYKEFTPSEPPSKHTMHAYGSKAQQNITKTPQHPLEHEPGTKCSAGIRCKQLQILLSNCVDVSGFHSSMKKDSDEFEDEINHCLECHSNFREKCIFEPHCSFTQKLTECHHHRLVQLHGHFYHNIAIDADESEGPQIKEQHKKGNEEKVEFIEYKAGNKVNKATNILEFGTRFLIHERKDARFKNPKKEMLQNTYHSLTKKEWNSLLTKCAGFSKNRIARKSKLNMKEIVALKLYTDFDQLQREFRKCFRGDDIKIRKKRQREFYWWNDLLERVCKKSNNSITCKLFHGVNDQKLSASCFSGTYYGPVSTTTDLRIARGFAGDEGQILELYPSFGAKGLSVAWLSNFPDENEVLYMNVSFQISNIVKVKNDMIVESDFNFDSVLNPGKLTESNMEYCILKALQTINVDSQIISLNDMNDDDKNASDLSNFKRLKDYEKLSVLYLLYLQYRPKEWDEFVSKSKQDYFFNAFMKFRDQFICLAENVTAVSMDNICKILQIFFYSNPSDYKLPILNKDQDLRSMYTNLETNYKAHQPFYFSIIVKLFPSAQQIAINAANFDWSLKRFVDFLSLYDFEFNKIALQDIYIRNIEDASAKDKLVIHQARDNLYTLKKLGWIFVSSTHLHRVQFEPLPALPFLMTFSDYNKDEEQNCRRIFRSHSQFIMLNSHMTAGGDFDDDEEEKKEGNNDDEEQGPQYILVDHDPKSCVLSKQIFNTLDYKDKLSELLIWKQLNWKMKVNYNMAEPGIDNSTERLNYRFAAECNNVESLVLDPSPQELHKIFYDIHDASKSNKSNKRSNKGVISFKKVIKVFPNLTDLFLRNTTFKLRECYKFIKFMNGFQYQPDQPLKLERIFFSKTDPIRKHDVNKVKLRLKEIGWNFINAQQMICITAKTGQK